MTFLKTFEQANRVDKDINQEDFDRMARDDSACHVCGRHVWRYAENGLCFTCTTGEADSSDDYEIGEEYDN